jgi:hypothetical protein
MHTTEKQVEATASHVMTALNNGDLGNLARKLADEVQALNTHRTQPAALADLACRLALMTKVVANIACDANHHRARSLDACEAYKSDPAAHTALADACQFLAVALVERRAEICLARNNVR